MAGEKAIKLTRFEMEIMEAVWKVGSGSVREIQEALAPENRPAYTTVQTIIYRLEEKGAVRRVKKIGNAHIFEAVISRQSAKQKIVNELLDLFGGSARPLMAHLAEAGKLSLEDIREMEAMLTELDSKSERKSKERDKSEQK